MSFVIELSLSCRTLELLNYSMIGYDCYLLMYVVHEFELLASVSSNRDACSCCLVDVEN